MNGAVAISFAIGLIFSSLAISEGWSKSVEAKAKASVEIAQETTKQIQYQWKIDSLNSIKGVK